MPCSLMLISGNILEIAFNLILVKCGVPVLGTDSSEFLYLKWDFEELVPYNDVINSNQWSSSKS